VNAGPTAERIYEALKNAVMTRAYRPGARLDPAVLAEEMNSSTTPVREALDRLVGENLVESRTGSGFHLPALDEPALKDMYAWSSELLGLAVGGWARGVGQRQPTDTAEQQEQQPVASQAAWLFAEIARRSTNSEHARAVERLNARLHAVRTVEPLVIEAAAGELETLHAAFSADDKAALRHAIGAYHRRRIRASAAIVRALYRAT
jgi:DNA-binding GntR family transcriptional regulator